MFTLNCRGRMLVAGRPLVMGVLNVTPDSFYADSRSVSVDEVLASAAAMVTGGADLLDIGGQSSRPGAAEVGPDEELRRIIDPIRALSARFPEISLSVDTWHAEVAAGAVAAGASIINDISGGAFDPAMLDMAAALGTPYIAMHMKGRPVTMNREAHYEDLTREVLDRFIGSIEDCRRAGIHDLILDPGIGFAKHGGHNFVLLRDLPLLARMTGRPLLLGVSRKSFIYKTLGLPGPADALNGTTVMNTLALLHGAAILRVHDPMEAREAVRLIEAYKSEGSRA